MRKLSRFGAAALALALSLTMVAPIGAKAAYKQMSPDSFQDRYSGISEVTGTQIKENKDAAGKVVSYTDITTGQTATEKGDLIDHTAPKKMQIPVKEDVFVTIHVGNGDCEVKNVKSSSKKTIKAEVSGFNKTTDADKIGTDTDATTGQLYYVDQVTGKKVVVANADAAPNASHGSCTIRLFAYKAGTTKLSYDVYNNLGQKTATVKIKVTAKDVDPFKSVTFAGKSLLWDSTKGATNAKYYGEGKYGAYTTKKAGKISIKMNKGYKLVRVITATANKFETKPMNVTPPDYGENTSRIQSPFTSDWLAGDPDYTYTDRGAKKSFKLKLSGDPGKYSSKYGWTGEHAWESSYYSDKNTSTETEIYIFFVDQSTKKLYRYHTSITRRLAK